MSTQRFVGPYQPYQNMLADAANRFTLLDPRTGKEAMDLNRIAELNPNQHDPNILWSIHNDNAQLLLLRLIVLWKMVLIFA